MKKKSIHLFILASLGALISAFFIFIVLCGIFLDLNKEDSHGLFLYIAKLSLWRKIGYLVLGLLTGLGSGLFFGAALDYLARSKNKNPK